MLPPTPARSPTFPARTASARNGSPGDGGGGLVPGGPPKKRIDPGELPALGLPEPRVFAVPANTLVVADTFGFHARGPSAGRSLRVEIWAYGRRSPFVPWTALDPWTGAALGR